MRKAATLYFIVPLIIVFAVFGRFLTDFQESSFGESTHFDTYGFVTIAKELARGRFLLWDNRQGAGVSAIGNPLYPQTYPVVYIFLWLFKNNYLLLTKFYYFSHILIAGCTFLLLTRSLKIKYIAGLLGMVAYVANSNVIQVIVQNGYRSEINTLAWMPLIFLLFVTAIEKKSLIYSFFSGLVFSMLIHSGALYNTNFVAISLVLFSFSCWIFRTTKLTNIFKVLLVFVLSSFAFSAVKLLPVMEFLKISSRNTYTVEQAEFDLPQSFNLYTGLLKRTVVDNFFVQAKFASLGIFLLAAVAVLSDKKRMVIPLITVSTISLAASAGRTLPVDVYAVFYQVVPLFKSSHAASRFLVWIWFSVPVLTAFGLDWIISSGRRFLGIAISIFVIITVIIHGSGVIKNLSWRKYTLSTLDKLLLDLKQKEPSPVRIIGGLESGNQSMYSYTSVKYDSFDTIANWYNNARPYYYDVYHVPHENLESSYKPWSIFNVKYLIAPKDKYPMIHQSRREINFLENDEGMIIPGEVIEFLNIRQRFSFVPYGVLYTGSDNKTVNNIVLKDSFDINRTTIFSGNNSGKDSSLFDCVISDDTYKNNECWVRASDSKNMQLKINNFTENPGAMSVEFETDRKGFFVYSNTYYPGWEARLDGKEVPVYMADSYVKGVVVPTGGKHTLEMEYKPKSFYLGVAITFGSSLFLICFLFRQYYRRLCDFLRSRRKL